MEKRIIEIMKVVLREDDINSESTQESLENWTSLRHLNLASELEDEFDIELDPSDICKMKSVNQIAAVIKQKLALWGKHPYL